mgnify:CR=1 FL=1
MKQRTDDWLSLANAAVSARNRLRTDALAGLDSILRQRLDPAVRRRVERVRAAVLDGVNLLRAALKGRRRV